MSDKYAIETLFSNLQQAIVDGDNALAVSLLESVEEDLSLLLGISNMAGTLLHAAARYGRTLLVQHLVEAGAPVDFACDYIGTPLLVAATEGHIDVVRYLHEQGADLNAGGRIFGGSALLPAVMLGRTDVALYLLENGAICDDSLKTLHHGRWGHAAIDFAVSCDNVPVFFKLVERGALDARKVAPIEFALKQNAPKIVQACLDESDYAAPLRDGRDIGQLIDACLNDDVRALMQSWHARQRMRAVIGEPKI